MPRDSLEDDEDDLVFLNRVHNEMKKGGITPAYSTNVLHHGVPYNLMMHDPAEYMDREIAKLNAKPKWNASMPTSTMQMRPEKMDRFFKSHPDWNKYMWGTTPGKPPPPPAARGGTLLSVDQVFRNLNNPRVRFDPNIARFVGQRRRSRRNRRKSRSRRRSRRRSRGPNR